MVVGCAEAVVAFFDEGSVVVDFLHDSDMAVATHSRDVRAVVDYGADPRFMAAGPASACPMAKPHRRVAGGVERDVVGVIAGVGVLLVLLLIVLIPRGGSGSSASGGSSASAGAEQQLSRATSSVAAGSCGAGASDDDSVMDAAPKGTSWVTTDAGWIGPVSKTAGPMVNSPIRSCFEHSAEGALYAAVWASIEINEAPEAYMPTVVGPGAEAARQNRKGDTKTRTVTRVAGYRYVSYTPERATVRVLFQIPSGAYRSWDVVMEWHDGDWHFWVPSTLPQFSSADPDDFITWGS